MKLIDYDTVIVDLDFTIWDGCEPNYWAKLLTPPYTISRNRIYDCTGKYIELHFGVPLVLSVLKQCGVRCGFASVGGIKDLSVEAQPSIIALKLFDIYK